MTRPVAIGIALLAVAAGGFLYASLSRPEMSVTPLPKNGSESPEVGPLQISAGSKLRIIAAEFRAELDSSGAGTISKIDLAQSPPRLLAPSAFTLDRETFDKLLSELGKLKASWSARKAGETALSPDLRVAPEDPIADESQPSILIEEIRADGSRRLILQLSNDSAEFAQTQDALTPLRLIE